jgi:hypothetical protein
LTLLFCQIINSAFTVLAAFGEDAFPVVVFQWETGNSISIPPVFRVSHDIPPLPL